MIQAPDPALVFDRRLHAQRRRRAAAGFPDAAFLKERAVEDVCDRLEAINRRFARALDLGGHGGFFARAIASRPALAARIDWLVETDLSPAMLARAGGPAVAADEERLPFAGESFDLIVSTLSLHWVNDLPGAFVQARRALRPDGVFIAALLGGRTLAALRHALLRAEDEITGGAAMRVSPFADAQDLAGLLQRAGFTLPVADSDLQIVRYRHPLGLLADLRAMGETNALLARSPRALRRDVLMRALALYTYTMSDPDGRVRVEFEIVCATGWAAHESQQKPLRPGSATARLADALGGREISAGEKAGR